MTFKSGKYSKEKTGKITRLIDVLINKELKKVQAEGGFRNIDLMLKDMINCYRLVKKTQVNMGFQSVEAMLKSLIDWYSLKPKAN